MGGPGPHGRGDLGPAAHAFVRDLARARQSVWQILPLAPPGFGGSPYASSSAFAGDALLVNPDLLVSPRGPRPPPRPHRAPRPPGRHA